MDCTCGSKAVGSPAHSSWCDSQALEHNNPYLFLHGKATQHKGCYLFLTNRYRVVYEILKDTFAKEWGFCMTTGVTGEIELTNGSRIYITSDFCTTRGSQYDGVIAEAPWPDNIRALVFPKGGWTRTMDPQTGNIV